MKLMLSVCLVFLGAICVQCGIAADDGFPSRPIRYVIGNPPGGAADTLGRLVAQRISENVRQPVIIDNKPGASGAVAVQFVVGSPRDGYTVLSGSDTTLINPMLNANVAYDVRRDLAPVTLMVNMKYVLIANPSVPARTLAELIGLATSRPGKLNYSSIGVGATDQFFMESFKRSAGVDIVHVPYKGGGPAMLALLANDVQLAFISVSTALPYVKSGKARVLAMLGSDRYPALPDVPTLSELGYRNFDSLWIGMFAPAKTPTSIIQRLNAEFVKALNAPDVMERLNGQGLEVVASSPAAFAKTIENKSAFYGKLIREIGVKVE